jgi:hypothetical protein
MGLFGSALCHRDLFGFNGGKHFSCIAGFQRLKALKNIGYKK